MTGYLILLLLCILPSEKVVTAECDLVEVNHLYDDVGRLTFDQLIYFNWTGSRYDVIGWHILKKTITIKTDSDTYTTYNNVRQVDPVKKKEWEWNEQLKPEIERIPYTPSFTPGLDFPRLNRLTGKYEAKYYKDIGGMNVLMHVKSDSFRETWSTEDRELEEDKHYLPKILRPFHPLNSFGCTDDYYVRQLFNRKD
jgi:hypothetical protein